MKSLDYRIAKNPAYWIVWFMAIAFLSAWAFGATYYVDFTTGLDSDNGTTEELAWKTLGNIAAGDITPGDTILLKKGETWREQWTFPETGTEGNLYTVSSYGTGADPIIDGSAILASSGWSLNVALSDFTTWTEEGDAGAFVTVAANTVTFADLPRGDADVADQYSLAVAQTLATNSTITFAFTVASTSQTNGTCMLFVACDETIDEPYDDLNVHHANSWGLQSQFNAADNVTMMLYSAGTLRDTSSVLADDTTYYVVLFKTGTTVTVEIYSDAAHTTLVDSITGAIPDATYDNIGQCMWSSSNSTPQYDGTFVNLQVGTQQWKYDVTATGQVHQIWFDDVLAPISRWPSSGVKTIAADADGNVEYFIHADLTQVDDYWNGATVVSRPTYYTWQAATILDTVDADNKITFAAQTDVNTGYGFYIVNLPADCDADKEWASTATTVVLYLAQGTIPSDYVITGATEDYGVYLNNMDYISIDGITIKKTDSWGVYVSDGDTVTISDCTIDDCYGGVRAVSSSSAVTVAGCTISDTYWMGGIDVESCSSLIVSANTLQDIASSTTYPAPVFTNGPHGIYSDSVTTTITNNTIDDIGRNGIYVASNCTSGTVSGNTISDYLLSSADGGGIYTYGDHSSELNIMRNIISGGSYFTTGSPGSAGGCYDIGIYLDNNCDDTNVYYNLIYSCASIGIHINTGTLGANPVSNDNNILNNTIYDCDVYGIFIQEGADDTLLTLAVENNLIYLTAAAAVAIHEDDSAGSAAPHSQTLNYNFYYNTEETAVLMLDGVEKSLADWKTATGYDANTQAIADPKLVNPGTNFRLLHGSPCLSTGVDVSLTSDLLGHTVPIPGGSAPDIGCYERLLPRAAYNLNME